MKAPYLEDCKFHEEFVNENAMKIENMCILGQDDFDFPGETFFFQFKKNWSN